jgi:hypothetical protein
VVEEMESKLILDAPLALASDGLVLADPTPDELLAPALPAAAPPGPYGAAPPPTASLGGSAGDELQLNLLSTTSCCGQGTFTVGVVKLGDVSEGIPGEPLTNYFKFFANGCGVPPPTSVTVGFSLAGGTATTNIDWNGALASGTTTITLTAVYPGSPNTYGEKLVDFTAIDDDLDEPDETIRVTVNSASANTGAALMTPMPLPPIDALVTSGDYTFSFWYQNKDGQLTDNTNGDVTVLDLSNGQAHYPTAERTFAVRITENGDPRGNVEVKLTRAGAFAGGDAKLVVNENGMEKEVDEATATTDPQGFARFTIRGKKVGSVRFSASIAKNGEDRPQVSRDQLSVSVRD